VKPRGLFKWKTLTNRYQCLSGADPIDRRGSGGWPQTPKTQTPDLDNNILPLSRPPNTIQSDPMRTNSQFPGGMGCSTHCENKSLTDWVSGSEKGQEQWQTNTPPPGFSTSFSRPTPSVSLSGSSFRIDLRGEWVKQKGQPLNAAHTLPWVYYFPSSLLFFCSFFHNCLPHILWSLLIWVLSTLRWHGCSWAQTTNGDTCFIEWPQPT